MTQEQKDCLLAKLINTPELLTPQDTDAILSDEYLCQIFSTAALLKAACRPSTVYDTDSEWAAFSHSHLHPRREAGASAPDRVVPHTASRRFTPKNFAYWRIAAIVVGVVAVAALALSLLHVFVVADPEPLTAAVAPDSVPAHAVSVSASALAAADTLTLSPHELDHVIVAPPAASKPHKSLAHRSPEAPPVAQPAPVAAASLPVDQEKLQRQLELQQARVDNEIAQNIADVCLHQYFTVQRVNNRNPVLPAVSPISSETAPKAASPLMRVIMQ